MSGEIHVGTCEIGPDQFARFVDGKATSSERVQILTHLLAGCTPCRRALRQFQRLDGTPDEGLSISRVLAAVAEKERQFESERGAAARLMESFARHPTARQWTLVRNSRRFDTWAFGSLLLDHAFDAIYDDPHRAAELCRLGLAIAERLDPAVYGASALRDLVGRALGRLANALRASGDLHAADETLERARVALEEGSGDPLDEAEHLYFRASLRRAQRRLDEARRAARRSRRLYRILGDAHLEGRSLLCEAAIHDLSGDLVRAEASTRLAVQKIDGDRDVRLALAVRHNLIWYLVGLGRATDAEAELLQLRPLYFEQGDRMNLLRLRWLEGRIARALGQNARAESALRDAQEGFVEARIPYEAATVAFDLAALLAEQGRTSELRALAGELVSVYRDLGVGREAIAALIVFQRAAEAEAVTLGLVGQLADYFVKAKAHPELRFESGA